MTNPFGLDDGTPPRERRGQRERLRRAGRKMFLTLLMLGAPFVTCTVALFLGKLSGGEYVTFLVTTIPMGLGIHHAANVTQKVGLAKAGVLPPGYDDVD